MNTHYSFAKNLEDSNCVLFTGLPMPPTSNNQYRLCYRGGKMLHRATHQLTRFKELMNKYPLTCASQFMASKQLIQSWKGVPLEITCVFFFHKSRLINRKGEFKRLDVSNRLKAAHDSICRLLEIDDSQFFRVIGEKAFCADSLDENFCVEIQRAEPVE